VPQIRVQRGRRHERGAHHITRIEAANFASPSRFGVRLAGGCVGFFEVGFCGGFGGFCMAPTYC
jgi:hypothetical protein